MHVLDLTLTFTALFQDYAVSRQGRAGSACLLHDSTSVETTETVHRFAGRQTCDI